LNPSGHRPTWNNTPVQTQEGQRRGSRNLELPTTRGTTRAPLRARAPTTIAAGLLSALNPNVVVGVRGTVVHIVLVLPFALLTLVAAVARRSRVGARLRASTEARRLVPSLVLMAAWAVTNAVSYGSARFRAAIEPSLAVFAALGIAIVVSAPSQRGRTEPAS
jgi:hypothetical protein